jgi:hypothetical protein
VTILSIAHPQRPTVVAEAALPAGPIAMVGRTLAVGGASALQLHELGEGGSLRLTHTLPLSPTMALAAVGERLVAITPAGVALIAPTIGAVEHLLPLPEAPARGAQLLVHGEVAYLLGTSAAGAPICRALRLGASPQVGGTCPFLAGKTTLLGGWAYVNPSPTSAEYLDYKVYDLSDPLQPTPAGTTPVRFGAAASVGGAFLATTFDHRLLRLTQSATGALATLPLGWSADTLAAEGDHRLLHDGVLYVDMGPTADGRMVKRLDFRTPGRPAQLPALVSPALASGVWQATARHLYTAGSGGLVLIDLASGVEVGRLALAPGERATTLALSPQGVAYLTTESNVVLAIDVSEPSAPRLLSRLGLPGRTRHSVWAAGRLYLFGEESLTIVTLGKSGGFGAVKQLPVEPEVLDVTATARALLVRRPGTLQLLDLRTPDTPQPALLEVGEDTIIDLLPAAGDRVAVVVRLVPPPGALDVAAAPARNLLRIFDLSATPRLIAEVALDGGETPLFDGELLLFEDLSALRLDGVRRVASAWEAAAGSWSPRAGVEYAPVAKEGTPGLCIEEVTDGGPTGALDGGLPGAPVGSPAARTAVFRARLFDCASGRSTGAAIGVTLDHPKAAGPASAPDAERPALDGGSAWLAPQPLESSESGWHFVTPAGAGWALVGPPPEGVHLPAVRR